MILYHGTNLNIEKIDLKLCRPYKDFGKGFYLTTIKEQATKMALRTSKLYGGDPVIISYEIRDDFLSLSELNIKNFGRKTSADWAKFVMNNRNRTFKDIKSFECNLDNKYDIVAGPIANDDMVMLFRKFENEDITFDALLKKMTYRDMTNQYSFHSEKAVLLLIKKEVCYVKN